MVKISTGIKTNTTWNRYEITFTLPSDAISDIVSFCCSQGTIGSTYFDCLQVEESTIASNYNLIENCDFTYQYTYDEYLYAENWDIHPGSGLYSCCIESSSRFEMDNNCIKFGIPDDDGYISAEQYINVNGNANETFTLNWWGKAYTKYFNPCIFIVFTFFNNDDTEDYYVFEHTSLCDDWQFCFAKAISPKPYNRISIAIAAADNIYRPGIFNPVYFDGIQLFKDNQQQDFTYDDNQNLTSETDLNNGTTNYAYTNNDCTEVTLPSTSTITNGYDSHHNMTSTTSEESVQTTTEYDTYGNPTAVKTVLASNPTIETNTSYTSNGNYVSTTTDEARQVTTYQYNAQLGYLNSIQYPNDTSGTHLLTYDYDDMGKLTSTSMDVSNLYSGTTMENTYTYEDDRIKTISNNNTTYTYNYGDFGTVSNLQVGTTRTLVSNEYITSDRSYDLYKSTFGNSDWVQYAYDLYDRVTGIRYETDSADRFSFIYDSLGKLKKMNDESNNSSAKYYYNSSDWITRVIESGINGRTYAHDYSWGYDIVGNKTSLLDIINSDSRTTNYTYDGDNRLTAVNFNYGSRSSKTEWIYDGYGRISNRNVYDINTNQIFNTITGYVNPDANHTTNLIATIRNKRYTAGGYDKTLTYSYDNNGNITNISDGTNATSYVYDEANQLVRENNQAEGKTWTWQYDANGNIRNKKEYAYTTGTLGSVLSTKTYEYNDASGWGDLLTSYDGATISYDGMGNPTGDGTWTYTWEGGRNLIGLSKTGTTATYKYNSDGVRTSKTVNSVTTTYTLIDGRVTHETNGTDSIYYRYDSYDNLISMNLNGTEYYYFRNAQGDVMGLFDTNGDMVVEYTYDAWGNILSTTGSLASTVGVKNPYRYRGYRYDAESGLYYLQSRYYNPGWGRFI